MNPPYIREMAPVKMPTIKIITKIANAAGIAETIRGRMSFNDLRSAFSALRNLFILKTNHISPAIGREIRRKTGKGKAPANVKIKKRKTNIPAITLRKKPIVLISETSFIILVT